MLLVALLVVWPGSVLGKELGFLVVSQAVY
jgi:hypothetical protein